MFLSFVPGWRWLVGLTAFLCIAQMIALIFCPQTPKVIFLSFFLFFSFFFFPFFKIGPNKITLNFENIIIKWLVMKKRNQEALRVLRNLRGPKAEESANGEFEIMIDNQEYSDSYGISLKQLFTDITLRRSLFIAVGLQLSQQVILFYFFCVCMCVFSVKFANSKKKRNAFVFTKGKRKRKKEKVKRERGMKRKREKVKK